MFFATENFPILIASLSFVVIILFSLGVTLYVQGRSQRRKMLEKIRQTDNDWSIAGQEYSLLDVSDKPVNPMAKFLRVIGMKTNAGKSTDAAEIKLKFLKAGIADRNFSTVFWGTKILLAVVLPTAFWALVIAFLGDMQSTHVVLGTVFLVLLGLCLPDVWLRLKTSKRKEKLFKGFPDALDLLVVCMEAGMGLDAAIRRVGDELTLNHPDLSHEFNQLNLELRAGKNKDIALKNLASRTDLEDVSSLVTLLIQTNRFGTSVAKALRVFADSFRTTRFQRAEEKAAKISTKLIFPLALFIFPSFFLVAIGPALIQAYRLFMK